MDEKSFQKCIVVAVVLGFMLGPVASIFAGEDVAGDWEFKMTFGEREITAKVSFSKNADGSYSGTWTGRRGDGAFRM